MERTVKEVHGSLQVTLPKELAKRSGISKGMHVMFEEHASGLLLRSSPVEDRVLWTIGYEGQTTDSFVGELTKRGIQRLIDIREVPLSRKRGFSKNALADKLEEAGISYLHKRELGAPRAVRKPFVAGGSFAAFRQGYLAHLETAHDALRVLEREALERRAVIMCVEHVHGECHRQFVAQAIAARGFEIRHIQSRRD